MTSQDPPAEDPSPDPPAKAAVPASGRSPLEMVRAFGPPLVLVGSLVGFAIFANKFYPIGDWLFWRYAGYWIACACWGVACLSLGDFIIKKLMLQRGPFREHLGLSFAVGVVTYYFAMTLVGLAHLYHWALFFMVPLVMLAIGADGLFGTSKRFFRHVRAARARARPAPAWTWLIVLFGLVGFGMVYFLVLTPDNVQFDSRWKHFALAEQYAVTGGVRRFPEGWTVETNPHLATYVYLWAFLMPIGKFFDRTELAAHLEFTIFVATTLMIPALVRRIVPRTTARHAWAARFLFPGVFLYDSGVSGGADHISALFTLPLFIVLLRASRDLSWRACSLLAIVAAGGMMTKLTGLLMLMPVPALVLGVRAVMIATKKNLGPARQNAWKGPLAALGVALVATSTFWLKNWIFYGDPLYPSLYPYLTLRPWTVDSANMFEEGYKQFQFWRPSRDLAGFGRTLKAMLDFSFIPNDYPNYHGRVPVFGSLFTILFLCLPFLRNTRRVWALSGTVYVALFVWYWTHHQDRYLQTLLPWMATVTASILILLFRTNLPTRIATGGLVGLQIVWGGDVYFIPTRGTLKAAIELLGGGYLRRYKTRFRDPSWVAVGDALPPDARVLLHDNHVHLGIHASTVSDWGGWQFGISYGREKTPGDVFDLLTKMEVTHIVWDPEISHGWDSLAGDLNFFHFATHVATNVKTVAGYNIAKMPPARPTGSLGRVLFLGCENMYRSGLYDIADMTVPAFGKKLRYPRPRVAGPSDEHPIEELSRDATFVVNDPKCVPDPDLPGFEVIAFRNLVYGHKSDADWTIWERAQEGSAPKAAPTPRPHEDDAP